MDKYTVGFESICIKESIHPDQIKSHVPPIYASSGFEFDSFYEATQIFKGETKGFVYGRYGNPTSELVASKLAKLESFGTDKNLECLLCSSGMAAIYLAVISSTKQHTSVITQHNLYGGTSELFTKTMTDQSRGIVFADLNNLSQVEQIMREDKSVKALYLETPSNPDLQIVDLENICGLAKKYDITVIVDNTFCTPYLQRPIALGADIVVHSTTKFLNGHGNMTGGAIIFGSQSEINAKLRENLKLLGSMPSPFDSWILGNGMKTLAVRMERHCENAEKLAITLANHPKVKKVNYPGLQSHPGHTIAKKQMERFGSMLSFELKGGLNEGKKFMESITFCSLAPTLGNIDTLVMHPASMSHLKIPKTIREQIGVTDSLIRVSTGLESYKDIESDLLNAIELA